MNAKAKSNSIITHAVGDQRITFTVKGVGNLVLDLTRLNSANLERAAIHGFIQRISDGAAKSRDTETGKPASPQEKFDAMKRLVDHYETGTSDWSLVRESAGSLLYRALCALSKKTPEQVAIWMKTQSAAQLRVLAMEDKIVAKMNEIRPVGDVDTDEMLGELGIE